MNTGVSIADGSPMPAPIDIIHSLDISSLRILVIEDDSMIGMLFAETLAGMGHTVCALAASQEEAVLAAREHRPDLMIVDARLGAGSGIRAVETILAHRFVPHVFVTGDKTAVAGELPEAIIVEKPFYVAELAAAMRRAMCAQRNHLKLICGE
jgi:two-component system, response regulator PdtaR